MPVLAEVDAVATVDELATSRAERRIWPPWPGVRDPRCTDDVDARVALVAEATGVAGVDADAHAHAALLGPVRVAESALRRERGIRRRPRLGERGEELVADGVHRPPRLRWATAPCRAGL